MTKIKVYIAGPDVFRPEAKAFFDTAKSLCEQLEMVALCPLSLELKTPKDVFLHNVKLLTECDGVVANVNSFRGPGADEGTSWEMGFAYALNKPVVSYMENIASLHEKTAVHFGDLYASSMTGHVFPDGMKAEEWGLPVNLMLDQGSRALVHGGLLQALTALRTVVKTPPCHKRRLPV
jgi:nucleoside 2-deoxyribosyltransferase